jgi:hypothetical protein
MHIPAIRPEWRTSTVVALCQGMREAQDFGAMPILADALQDAGCGDESLLTELRTPNLRYSVSAALVACAWSEAGAKAVEMFDALVRATDCPSFETTLAAASGNHHENDGGDGDHYSEIAEWDCDYLHFNGSDAHGAIPAGFWDLVETICGKKLSDDEKPSRFSCSC